MWKYFLITLSITLLIVSTSCKPDQEKQKPEEITAETQETEAVKSGLTTVFVIGNVDILRKSGESTLAVGDIAGSDDVIRTGNKSSAKLRYQDLGIVVIGENSEFCIDSLADETDTNTRMELKKGSISMTLGKLKKETLHVSTQTMVAAVRGTSFTVKSDGTKSSVMVIKGSVAVAPASSKPGEDKDTATSSGEVIVSEGRKVEVLQKDSTDVIEGNKQLRAVPMTRTELKEAKETISSIGTDEIQGVNPEVIEEIQKKVPEAIDDAEQKIRKERKNTVSIDNVKPGKSRAEKPDKIVSINPENREATEKKLSDTKHLISRRDAPVIVLENKKPIMMRAIDFSSKKGVNIKWNKVLTTYVVGSNDSNDWIEYQLNVPESGDYRITYYIISREWKGEIEFIADNYVKTTKVPQTTNSYDGDAPVGKVDYVKLNKGAQTIRLRMKEGGNFSLCYISIKKGRKFSLSEFFGLSGNRENDNPQ